MKAPRGHRLIAFAAVCAMALTVHPAPTKKEKKEKKIRRMAKDTLQSFYRAIHRPKELAARKVQWTKTRLDKDWFVYTGRQARRFCQFWPGYDISSGGTILGLHPSWPLPHIQTVK